MSATALLEGVDVPAPVAPDSLFEVVDGRYVEPPPMGASEGVIGSLLAHHLNAFALARGLGIAVAEILFDLGPAVGRKRRPDAAFVSFERWAKGRRIPPGDAWPVVPDLAVEVVSPNDAAVDLIAKVGEYFRAGVRLVWVIYPGEALVYAYESPTRVRILARAEALDGGAVLPGFALPLASLLDDPAAA